MIKQKGRVRAREIVVVDNSKGLVCCSLADVIKDKEDNTWIDGEDVDDDNDGDNKFTNNNNNKIYRHKIKN